jgi:hypothetical protein
MAAFIAAEKSRPRILGRDLRGTGGGLRRGCPQHTSTGALRGIRAVITPAWMTPDAPRDRLYGPLTGASWPPSRLLVRSPSRSPHCAAERGWMCRRWSPRPRLHRWRRPGRERRRGEAAGRGDRPPRRFGGRFGLRSWSPESGISCAGVGLISVGVSRSPCCKGRRSVNSRLGVLPRAVREARHGGDDRQTWPKRFGGGCDLPGRGRPASLGFPEVGIA